MKPKLLVGLALVLSGGLLSCCTESFADSGGMNDDFQLETEINIVEKFASDWKLQATSSNHGYPWIVMDNALVKLDEHYSLWATNTSIPPRLGKAVLTIFPDLTNAFVKPEPGLEWCISIQMLAKTHDPAVLCLLRPYLKQKDLADDPGGYGAGITTMRICDEAAGAIISLLKLNLNFRNTGHGQRELNVELFPHEVFTNGISVRTWRCHTSGSSETKDWSGYDPAWEGRDEKIAELQKILDALPNK